MKTTEEVKEHFKNAKEVRCIADGEIYEIDIETTINYEFDNWCKSIDNVNVKLSKQYAFAEIISYKENPIQRDEFYYYTKELKRE
jgi:predicted RNA-binding protein with TRAM domain